MTTRKRPYVQFSKKIVVAVNVCVTALSLIAIVLIYLAGQVSYIADVIKMYIAYGMVVFAAYSGNSAIEKALVSGKLRGFFQTTNDQDDDPDNAEG